MCTYHRKILESNHLVVKHHLKHIHNIHSLNIKKNIDLPKHITDEYQNSLLQFFNLFFW
jgi:hypothetical protein